MVLNTDLPLWAPTSVALASQFFTHTHTGFLTVYFNPDRLPFQMPVANASLWTRLLIDWL